MSAGAVVRASRRAHTAFRDDMTMRQRSGLVAYASFAATMVAVRGVTSAIHEHRLSALRDITVGRVHIHHYLPGIALLGAAGAFGLRGGDRIVVHCVAGATYGVGSALVVDELPLLVNLRDVYWTPEGRWALDLALTVGAVGGAYLSGVPLWRSIRRAL